MYCDLIYCNVILNLTDTESTLKQIRLFELSLKKKIDEEKIKTLFALPAGEKYEVIFPNADDINIQDNTESFWIEDGKPTKNKPALTISRRPNYKYMSRCRELFESHGWLFTTSNRKLYFSEWLGTNGFGILDLPHDILFLEWIANFLSDKMYRIIFSDLNNRLYQIIFENKKIIHNDFNNLTSEYLSELDLKTKNHKNYIPPNIIDIISDDLIKFAKKYPEFINIWHREGLSVKTLLYQEQYEWGSNTIVLDKLCHIKHMYSYIQALRNGHVVPRIDRSYIPKNPNECSYIVYETNIEDYDDD